jgi:adenylate kinase
VIILLLGAPGTGKSTYGRYLACRLGLPWISSGRLLREVAGRDRRIAGLIEAGELVPDDEVERVLFERLEGAGNGFVLDGYPRKVTQARNLLRFLEERSWRISRVYHLCAPDEVLMQRLLARGREDDRPDVIQERLRVYRLETEAIIDVLREAGIEIVDVDNSPPIDEVKRRLDASLQSLG